MAAAIRWAVPGAASIAVEKVIPAMQRGRPCRIDTIASRDAAKAHAVASALGIPRARGSYDAPLADPDVDAIDNPLPSRLHAPWTLRAIAAGKHVLCEKPIALSAAEAHTLIAARATAAAASASTTAAATSAGRRDARRTGGRPVHAPGRPLRRSDPRPGRRAGAARGCRREHGRDRRDLPLHGEQPAGDTVTGAPHGAA